MAKRVLEFWRLMVRRKIQINPAMTIPSAVLFSILPAKICARAWQ
jgi:hypothetical protein